MPFRKSISLLLCSLCLLQTIVSFAKATNDTSVQLLPITVETDTAVESSVQVIPAKKLGGNFDSDIHLFQLTNAFIQIGEQTNSLEDAIRDGEITVEELIAYAQIDARKGICLDIQTSINGLASHIYRYPEYDVYIINDIYETPDGNQHPITVFDIYKSGCAEAGYYPVFLSDSSNPTEYLDKEDWGLTFEFIDVSESNITLNCKQYGGQNFGTLHITKYYLYSYTDDKIYTPFFENQPQIAVNMNGETNIILPLADIQENLPSGNYFIRISLTDEYSPTNVHPLTRNYRDMQTYQVDFSIS